MKSLKAIVISLFVLSANSQANELVLIEDYELWSSTYLSERIRVIPKNAAIIESQCSDPDSYMVSTSLSHEVQSRIFSVLMTAKVANQPVKINVKGCEDNRPAITSAILL